jgi:integrase
MAQTIGRLSAVKVANLKVPGYYADGGNLYFRVAPSGVRGWIFRFTMGGRTRDMGLGAFPQIGLAASREIAENCRKLVKQDIDPIESRRSAQAERLASAAKAMTFDQAADAYMAAHRAGWKNPKHAAQWKATLATYASPVLGKLPVGAIDVGLVTKVLEPIWTTKSETAGRVRGRIECVLDWAAARGYCKGENPARWRGHLDKLLPARSKVRKVKHHPALPYDEQPAFMTALRAQEGISANALEFTILTAARTGETIGAAWPEIDMVGKVWTVPADRMKAEREHRVPLSGPALAILKRMAELRENEFVFPGGRRAALSNMAMLEMVRGMNERRTARGEPKWMDPRQRKEIVPHGFRSTFRDWASERTNFPREVAEAALAHVAGDETERAYQRGDFFEKRRRLMDEWARYCARPVAVGNNVHALRR